MALIDFQNVSLTYGKKPVLTGISLEIRAGDRLAILGGNGSGKSSLCQLLAGWSPAQKAEGSLLWQGRPASAWPLSERVSAVQLVGQIPAQHLSGRAFTVIEEIAFGPENLGLAITEIRRRVDAALTLTRLTALAERNPFTLSGGEQQRLVLASVLALEPKVLILDEPLTNLDPETHEAMTSVIEALPDDLALVLAETDPGLAARLTRDAVLLHEGGVAVAGPTPAVLTNPLTIGRIGLPAMTAALLQQLEERGVVPAALSDVPLTPDGLASFSQRLRNAED